MSKRVYDKVPLSIEAQIQLLRGRGLVIADEHRAQTYLQEISYYRLSAYFLPYQRDKDSFDEGTTFEQVVQTYCFDRDLRLLVFGCIERIEIAIRTQVIYRMAVHYCDSHWHDRPEFFVEPYRDAKGKTVNPYEDLQVIIRKAKAARTPEAYIKHYISTYHSPANPPSWMCFELLTIGELSRAYKGLNLKTDKKRIADFFELHPSIFESWLHSITYVRNICAHHARLWNRDLAIEPAMLKRPTGSWIRKPFHNNKRVFYLLCVLRYLLLRISPDNHLRLKLEHLFNEYPTVPIRYLGIPSDGHGVMLDWKSEDLWKVEQPKFQ